MGLCKELKPADKEVKETGIYHLPKVLIAEIVSYIPLEDYRFEILGESESDHASLN